MSRVWYVVAWPLGVWWIRRSRGFSFGEARLVWWAWYWWDGRWCQ